MAKNKSCLFLIISALISGLSVILPEYLGFFAWVSMIPFCYIFFTMTDNDSLRLRDYFLKFLLWFFFFYQVSFHFFVYLYPLDFTGINNFFSVIVIIFAWFGLSLLQALISSLVFLILAVFARLGSFKRYPVLSPFIFACVYVLAEWFQTIGWWGVPWARLSLSQVSALPIINSASLFGSYFVSFVIVFVNAALAMAAGHSKSSLRKQRFYALFALFVFLFNIIAGGISYGVTDASLSEEEKITVALVQGNFSVKMETSAKKDDYIVAYEEYSRRACEGQDVDLIIWPETAFPFNVKEGDWIEDRISLLAEELGVDILVGIMRHTDNGVYNCTIHARPDGSIDDTVYKKRHLVPFGEYVPMRGFFETLLPFLSDISMLSDDMTPGDSSELYEIDGIGKVASLICFDSIYESLTRDSVRDGARLIALGTNDSWFSDSVAIYLHNNQARLRSIECGRYTARAAVTGVCSIITPTGQVTDMTEPLVRDYLVGEVGLRDSNTLYLLIGNAFVYIIALLTCAALTYEITTCVMRKRRADINGEDLK